MAEMFVLVRTTLMFWSWLNIICTHNRMQNVSGGGMYHIALHKIIIGFKLCKLKLVKPAHLHTHQQYHMITVCHDFIPDDFVEGLKTRVCLFLCLSGCVSKYLVLLLMCHTKLVLFVIVGSRWPSRPSRT